MATVPSGLIDRGQEEVEHDGWIAADGVLDLVVATCRRTSSSTTRPSRRSRVEGRATSRAEGRERDDGDPLHAQTRDSRPRGGTPASSGLRMSIAGSKMGTCRCALSAPDCAHVRFLPQMEARAYRVLRG